MKNTWSVTSYLIFNNIDQIAQNFIRNCIIYKSLLNVEMLFIPFLISGVLWAQNKIFEHPSAFG